MILGSAMTLSRPDERPAVVVTGMSVWTCFGRGVDPLVDAIATGRRELRPLSGIDVSDRWFTAKSAMQIEAPTAIHRPFDGTTREVDAHRWPAALAVETALDAVVSAGHHHLDHPPHRQRLPMVILGT